MPSANTLAQKPAGNFNPVSSLEHAAVTEEGTRVKVARAMVTNHQCLDELSNRMEGTSESLPPHPALFVTNASVTTGVWHSLRETSFPASWKTYKSATSWLTWSLR